MINYSVDVQPLVFCVGRGVLPLPLGEAAPAPVKAEILETECTTSGGTSTAAGEETGSTVTAKASEDPLPTTRRAVMNHLSKLFTHKENKVSQVSSAVKLAHSTCKCLKNIQVEMLNS